MRMASPIPNSVLITGGTGYLGHGLVERLLRDGYQRICIFSRGEFQQAQMRAEFGNDSRLRWFIGDVRDASRLERAMEGVQEVIHAAALKRIEVGAMNPDEMKKTNIDGSMNVIEAARRAGVEKCLLVSSDKACQPVSPYGLSKAYAESLFLTAHNVSPGGPIYAAVRYGNVWGSTGSIVPMWREMLKKTDTVPVTAPDATRFFMWRAEAVRLVLDTLRDMKGGELAIPDLPAYRVGDLAEAMGARMRVIGMGEFEKLHESMRPGETSEHAPRMTVSDLRVALEAA